MLPVMEGKFYVARSVERDEVDLRVLLRGVSQVLSGWLYSRLQLDRCYGFSFARFLVSPWLPFTAPPISNASDPKERKTVTFFDLFI